jgi:hypothetical protein
MKVRHVNSQEQAHGLWGLLTGTFRAAALHNVDSIVGDDQETLPVPLADAVTDEVIRCLVRSGIEERFIDARSMLAARPADSTAHSDECIVYIRLHQWQAGASSAIPNLEAVLRNRLLKYNIHVKAVYWRVPAAGECADAESRGGRGHSLGHPF